jgi:hypothetical protein
VNTQSLAPVAEHTHRGLQWQLRGLVLSLAIVLLASASARTNPYSALLVLVGGLGLVALSRGFRAAGRLLQIVQPPSPPWVSRVATLTLVGGPMVAAFGAWLLFRYWRATP